MATLEEARVADKRNPKEQAEDMAGTHNLQVDGAGLGVVGARVRVERLAAGLPLELKLR